MAAYSKAQSGFLLPSFLLVLTMLLGIVAANLHSARLLLKASYLAAQYHQLSDTQSLAIQTLLIRVRDQQIPTSCWRRPVEAFLTLQQFQQQAKQYCQFSLRDAKHYYVVELLSEDLSNNLGGESEGAQQACICYRLLILTERYGQTQVESQFGVIRL
jgi:hypothetical protein